MFGFVEQKYDFRIVAWILFAMSSAFSLALIFILEETRASVLLSRKAAALRKSTGDMRYRSRDEAERGNFLMMMRTSLVRPIRLLLTEPVVMSFSIWMSFCWG